MTCRELEKYDKGEMSEAEFKRHATLCPACREALFLDKEVISLAEASRRPIDAPWLWSRIESALKTEMAEGENRGRKGFFLDRMPLGSLFTALIILVVVGLGICLGLRLRTPSSGLLAKRALAKVEQKEQEYVKAIQELEKQAFSRMSDIDLELGFLYRDRLEAIDAQIERCREALATNPANAHIRRYLMAALQDKKDTLGEVLNLISEKPIGRRST